jgi:sterol 24-C-methyltransferase
MPNSMNANKVRSVVDDYVSAYSGTAEAEERRQKAPEDITRKFYDLVTDFYQYGWGDSFHFAPRGKDETFREAIKRHEDFLALELGLAPGMTCLDLGCGVGGPMSEIGRFSGASITGININDYQIQKANQKMKDWGIYPACKAMNASFLDLPQESNSVDRAYAIEATCHAPDRNVCFSEIARVLKPGGLFAGYEWVSTPKYDENNKEHKAILQGIEKGNGLPPIISGKECLQALIDAGFEIVTWKDKALDKELFPVPWYEPLDGNFSLSGMRYTKVGRMFTHTMCSWCEWFRLFPQGTTDVSTLLMNTADDLVKGGKTGVFTTCFYFLARKKA